MLAMVMALKCFVCIFNTFRSCVSVLSILMVCGVLMCVNVVLDLIIYVFSVCGMAV